jgi:hypothetical protein
MRSIVVNRARWRLVRLCNALAATIGCSASGPMGNTSRYPLVVMQASSLY